MSFTPTLQSRLTLLQALLKNNGWNGILLNRIDNFAMLTGGARNYVSTQADLGACGIFAQDDGTVHYAGNSIEATRVMDEELPSPPFHAAPFLWCEESPASWCRANFDGVLVSDDGSLGENVDTDLAPLRSVLLPQECDAYRQLGTLAAEAVESTLRSITPGMAEYEISARLVYEGQRRGCQVPVSLVAADERITRYRHPLPTLPASPHENHVHKYVMVVVGMIRDGLSVSLTRFKQVATIPSDITDAYRRICAVDARMQEATRPEQTLGGVFAACQQAYVKFGFDKYEWHNHHQGGSTGYAGRTCKGVPGSAFPCMDTDWAATARECLGQDVALSSAFAWNPSAPGVKSEDTFLLHKDGSREIITQTPNLPRIDLSNLREDISDVVKSAMAPPEFA
ncbi:MAG: hypothetical protein L3K26_13375 [Candidatus Hydrogenedentes bacterium]|nr:hypothetical protein [Candidatus Hydrogenedentota bacterium]